MRATDKFVVVGKIGAPFGLHGWNSVTTYVDEPENFLDFAALYLAPASSESWQEIEYELHLRQNKLLLRLTDSVDRDRAKQLTNSVLAVRRDDLPALNSSEHYWTDLEGMEVINQFMVSLGYVSHLFNAGASDVMCVISKEKKSINIPFLKGYSVLEVDYDKHKIFIDWPEAVDEV